jgi:hypothetical protein
MKKKSLCHEFGFSVNYLLFAEVRSESCIYVTQILLIPTELKYTEKQHPTWR